MNRLLNVSQGVASSLEMQDSVKPVLEAILATGASCVRVVLEPDTLPDIPVQLPSRFAVGTARETYAHLDEQILELAQTQGQIVIPNLTLSRELAVNQSMQNPAALLAVALRHENRYYGVVWAGYDQLRGFSESDVSFIKTLAGQAALAVSNAHLFLNVEASRRQLEAILNSTPDPVLVTDHRNRLLLANCRGAGVAFEVERQCWSAYRKSNSTARPVRPVAGFRGRKTVGRNRPARWAHLLCDRFHSYSGRACGGARLHFARCDLFQGIGSDEV